MSTYRQTGATFLKALVVFPLLSIACAFLLTMLDGLPASSTPLDWLIVEGMLMLGTPYALRYGRYPTIVELLAWPRLGVALWLLLCWLFSALLVLAFSKIGSRGWYFLSHRVRQWVIGLLVICVVSRLAWLALPSPATAELHVDAISPLGPMPGHAYGFSQGGEGPMPTAGYFESAMGRLAPLQPRYVRLDHVFDYYGVYQLDSAGQKVYHWAELDRVVDAVIASGAQPVISLSYLPPALARQSVYGPPSDLADWEALVYKAVYHLNVERHLGIRYWEVWNEPNLPTFWSGTLDEYLHLYEVTAHGALRADPSIKLGGPATASFNGELRLDGRFFEYPWVSALLRYVQAHKLPLDFLSWHYYDPQPARYAESVRLHQRWLAEEGAHPELWLTEWNRSASPSASLDTEEGAVHAAAVLTTLADTALKQALFFEVVDSSTASEGRFGLMRADGVLKPVFNTFQLAAQLHGERMALQSTHPEVNGLAAREGAVLSILLWHLASGHPSLPVTLSVSSLPPQTLLRLSIYAVDAVHDNAFRSSDSEGLLIDMRTDRVSAQGVWIWQFELPANGIRLIKLQY